MAKANRGSKRTSKTKSQGRQPKAAPTPALVLATPLFAPPAPERTPVARTATPPPAPPTASAPTQAATNQQAWRARKLFLGLVSPAIAKDYLLILVFLKFIDDVWQTAREAISILFKDPDEGARQLTAMPIVVGPGAEFIELYAKRRLPGNGARVNAALRVLEAGNEAALGGLFAYVNFNGAPPCEQAVVDLRLGDLLELLGAPQFDFRPNQYGIVANARAVFSHLIAKFDGAGLRGDASPAAPQALAQLMVLLLAPKPGESAYDPTCGDGSVLFECLASVMNGFDRRDLSVYGQVARGGALMLARMNLLVLGCTNSFLALGDVLRMPRFINAEGGLARFEVVLGVPPFSPRRWGREDAASDPFGRFQRGVPPRADGSFAYVSHMIASMHPKKGRMAVVVRDAALSRGGETRAIIKALIDDNLLDGVIALPPGLFARDPAATTLLVFWCDRKDKRVLFVDARNRASPLPPFTTPKTLNDDILPDILEVYSTRSGVAGLSALAGPEQIAAKGYSLAVADFVFDPAMVQRPPC